MIFKKKDAVLVNSVFLFNDDLLFWVVRFVIAKDYTFSALVNSRL